MRVAQSRARNNTVLRFQDISHNFKEAAIDNRVLEGDCEALRTVVHFSLKFSQNSVKVLIEPFQKINIGQDNAVPKVTHLLSFPKVTGSTFSPC